MRRTRLQKKPETGRLRFEKDLAVNKKQIAFFLLWLLLFSSNAFAWTARDLDNLVESAMQESGMVGLVVGVSAHGSREIVRAYGDADLEHDVQMTADAVFPICSITKTLTALCVLKLYAEGRLDIKNTAAAYIPSAPYGRDITLEQLLRHMSGLADITKIEPFASNQARDYTPWELMAMFGAKPLEFTPGQQTRYSNSGYILLGLVVEKVAGLPYGAYLQQAVLDPLGMRATRLGSNAEIIPERVRGYRKVDGETRNAPQASLVAPYASGGVVSTIPDLLKLKQAFQPNRILPKRLLDDMFKPARLADKSLALESGSMTYGYGLDMVVRDGRLIPGKTGAISGFNTYFAYFPSKDLLIALAANTGGVIKDMVDLALAIEAKVE